ncbi:MAG: sigma-54 dependent transcriptional regulator [Candidatus Cloacimonetes bacterium]|nr:sigma-54 dependent transcriptional regulator [Candidatus Cloacimonadota bacterium]
MKGNVLILEDDQILAQQMAEILKRNGFQTKTTLNSDSFFQELAEYDPDVILLDIFLVGSKLNGLQVLKYLKTGANKNYKVIVISGEASKSQIDEIRKLGAYHFIEKGSGFNINQLILHVENAIQLKLQEEENIGLQNDYIGLKKQFAHAFPLIGDSPAIESVRQKIVKLAQADEDLFLMGETGTGKEVTANYYYLNSPRFGKPFRTVNCSALTETLIESELFGHGKGSFTGADKTKTGFFEECSKGVLFLDEITNLSLSAQSKILRAIENKEIQVVGSSLKKVDTKLIFATNSEISQLSDPAIFRKDLFYRIEGNIVELPPLRERGQDIILLMNYFFTNYSVKFDTQDTTDLTKLCDALLTYPWFGNVRELRNFCKFIIINEKRVSNDIILSHLKQKISTMRKSNCDQDTSFFGTGRLKDSVAAFEKAFLIKHLKDNHWNVFQTASNIGIERTTLYKKMKALNIQAPEQDDTP